MGANELSSVLWHERELLELLLFKLEEQQLILTAGKARWVTHATREVEQVVDRIRSSGIGRGVEIDAVATEWGTGPDASLRELAAAAPSGPWGEILLEHHRALAELTAQIASVREGNEALLRAALRSSQEAAAGDGPDAGTYDARGATASAQAGARIIDREL